MKSSVITLNPMDRHFFGKPLAQWAAERTDIPKKTTKFIESSIDDFNKYFDFMTQSLKKAQQPLERVPEKDVYIPEIKPSTIEDSLGPSF